MTKKTCIIFSHGKLGTPNSNKIKELSIIAKEKNFDTIAIDYTKCKNVEERIEKLYKTINKIATKNIVLVGSSMGGYISTVVSENKNIKALFLMCPAFYLPWYEHQSFKPSTKNITIVHGKQDETVSYKNSVIFSNKHKS